MDIGTYTEAGKENANGSWVKVNIGHDWGENN